MSAVKTELEEMLTKITDIVHNEDFKEIKEKLLKGNYPSSAELQNYIDEHGAGDILPLIMFLSEDPREEMNDYIDSVGFCKTFLKDFDL